MVQEILIKMDFISPIFYQVLYMTVVGSIVGLIIYFIRNIFDSKISGKWKCMMWIIALITLLVPIRFEIKTTKAPVIQSEIINKVEDIKYIGKYEQYSSRSFANIDNNEGKTIPNAEEVESTQSEIISSNENNKVPIPTKYITLNIILPAIWMLGTISFIVTFLSGIRKINRRISRNVYRDERLQNILMESKNQLHIKKKVKIILQKYKKVPSIFGIFNPSILITEQLLEEDNETIKYIFLHELSHYKRKDILFNFILLCILSIHWFNPVVWFLFKKIRQDIEIGADELASKNLNKDEVKQYGMVLINLLRSRIEENYTASMLCMSDTGKNMERRILMIKRKSTSIILSILLLIIIVGVVAGFVFVKVENVEELPSLSDINLFSNDDTIELVTEDEKAEISEYLEKICTGTYNTNTLPEFDDINNADKYWVYSHLQERIFSKSQLTKDEIENYLKKLYGTDLTVNLENDKSENEDLLRMSANIYYNEEQDVYELWPYGWDLNTWYAIDNIEKINNQYNVKLIEYFQTVDLEEKYGNIGDFSLIYTSDEIENKTNANEILKVKTANMERDELKQEIDNEVLKIKEEFRSYNVTLGYDSNGKICAKKIKLDTNHIENDNSNVVE